MKKLLTILIIALIPIFGFSQAAKYIFPLNEASSVAGDDVVPNGTFDSSTTGWNASGSTLASVAGGNPGNALRVTNNVSATGRAISDVITIVEGNSYIISWNAKAGTSQATFEAGTTGGATDIISAISTTATIWEAHSVTFVAPAGGDLYITLSTIFSGSNLTAYFDNVVMRQKDASTRESQTGALSTNTDVHCVQDDKGSGRRWYEFAPTNQYLENTADIADFTGSIGSIVAKIKLNTIGVYSVFASCDVASNVRYLNLHINASGNVEVQQNNDGTENLITGTTILSVDTEYTIALISTGTAYEIYIDGVDEGTLTVTAGANNGDWFTETTARDNITIGAMHILVGYTDDMDGNIYSVRVFDDDQGANMSYYANVANPIKSADEANCLLNFNAESIRINQAYDYLNDIVLDVTGATMVIPSSSNLGASNFTGVSDCHVNIDFVLDGLASTTQGTWMAEIWISDETPSASSIITSFGDTDETEYLIFFITIAGELSLIASDAGTAQFTVTTDDVLSYGVHHVAAVQKGIAGIDPILYVDGVAVAQTESVGTDVTSWFYELTGLDNGRIGCDNIASGGNSDWFGGTIRQAWFWTRALSASKVLEEYGKYSN